MSAPQTAREREIRQCISGYVSPEALASRTEEILKIVQAAERSAIERAKAKAALNPYETHADRRLRIMGDVISEIAAERKRQIEVEGWSPEHDDAHSDGSLATAAGWYALNAQSHDFADSIDVSDSRHEAWDVFAGEYRAWRWPWDMKWWKPKDRRRDLIRAAALIVAEIERLDRIQP